MQIRSAANNAHLILTITRSAWFWCNTLSETLSSPLEGRPMLWFSSWSSLKRKTHLLLWLSCSHRILSSCAGRQSPTSSFGSSSKREHAKSFWGSAQRNSWSSVQWNLWTMEAQLPKNWQLVTGPSSLLHWVAMIPPMSLLLAVVILRFYQ